MSWTPIPGFEESHEITPNGRIRTRRRLVWYTHWSTKKRHQRLKPPITVIPQLINSGYEVVHLQLDGKRYAKTVHSLVALTFIGPRPHKCDVCHKNGNRTDNRVENLRYATRTQNHRDKIAHGTNAWGEKIKQSKLTLKNVKYIRSLGHLSPAKKKQLAEEFGVIDETIRRVSIRETWRYV